LRDRGGEDIGHRCGQLRDRGGEENRCAGARRRGGVQLLARADGPGHRAGDARGSGGYAKATRPARLTALTVDLDESDTRALLAEWEPWDIDIPLTVVDSPYREITRPILEYIRRIRKQSPRDVVTVFIPEYVVVHWWENLLHNQSALRLKSRLLFEPDVMVTSVPYQLRSKDQANASSTRSASSTPAR
jgi:hypothetical protein